MAAAYVAERAYEAAARSALAALERNLIPDAVTRRLTRLLLAQRLRQGYLPSAPLQLQQLLQFVHCKFQLPTSTVNVPTAGYWYGPSRRLRRFWVEL